MKPVIIIAIAVVFVFSSATIYAQSQYDIPSWIKGVAGFWSEGQISDQEFGESLSFLIENDIVVVPKIQELENKITQIEDENNSLKRKIQGLEIALALSERYQDDLQDKLIEEKQQTISIAEDALKSEIMAMARTNPFLNGVIKGTINIYFEPVPSYAADGVSEVVKATSEVLDGVDFQVLKFIIVSNPSDADIHISWLKDFGSAKLGHAIFRTVVEVGIGEDNCHGDWQAYNASTVHKILMHELGHALGFNHSTKSNNIMYYTMQSQFSTDVDKTFELDEGDGKTFPFCKTGSMNYYLSSDDQNNGFYAYVLPSATDPSQFLNGVGKYYPSCSTEDAMRSFGTTCNIVSGDTLVVFNKNDLLQFSAIRVNLKVVDLNIMPTPDFTWDLNAFEYDLNWLQEVYDIFH